MTLSQPFDEVILFAKCRFEGAPVEVARQKVTLPELETEAVARPDKLINPVNLGAILVPYDWRCWRLARREIWKWRRFLIVATRDAAKSQRGLNLRRSRRSTKGVELMPGKKAQFTLPLPAPRLRPPRRTCSTSPSQRKMAKNSGTRRFKPCG